MIDSHCHLADQKFAQDLPDVVRRAQEAGVQTLITIADSVEESERCIALAEKYPCMYATVGVHPHHAKDWRAGDGDRLRAIVERHSKVKAIGEIGLDFHYNCSPKEDQIRAFEEQLVIATELQLPVVVHNRDSIEYTLRIIERLRPERLVLHCCTEKWEDVGPLIDRGYLLSFTGIATYDSASVMRDTIVQTPLTQMMIETDAPYLAPVPHRGMRNEPAFVVEVAKLIGELKNIPLEEVDRVTTANARAFFRLPTREETTA